ncbi:stretch-activated Ca2+-permeable channel component-domain-containing protein [Kalaharituber pfeilii]|nr:stretch-activated Ca2+-permeable channel component-domain-containing protein [Kalaharituber pfeilii]
MARIGGSNDVAGEFLPHDSTHQHQREKRDKTALRNGVPVDINIVFGQLQHWVLPEEDIFEDREDDTLDHDLSAGSSGESNDDTSSSSPALEKRQQRKLVYITFNTCLQPQFNLSLPLESPLPQLQVFISNSTANQTPGPEASNRPQSVMPIIQGYGSLAIEAAGSIFIGVYAANMSEEDQQKYTFDWNYEIAASTAGPYHGWTVKKNLYLVDTDNSAALLVTGNLTTDSTPPQSEIDEIMGGPTPYLLYTYNSQYPTTFRGLERSYCAVSKIPTPFLTTSLTQRGLGNLPKQQFHLSGLNKTSTYQAYLMRPPPQSLSPSLSRNSSIPFWGPVLWDSLTITTKTSTNCQLIYNLPFCSDIAYSVPSNPTVFSSPAQLATFYDTIAQNWYQNFEYSLQQVSCEPIDKSMKYSFARNCTDCKKAYRNWLCAVTVPRCADFTSTLPYLAERGLDTEFFNQTANATVPNDPEKIAFYSRGNDTYTASSLRSRNPEIDRVVRPGPYKEIKPCLDLCWSLVQSCPRVLGFTCPALGSWGQMVDYGERSMDGDVTCSWIGAVYFLSGAERKVGWAGLWGVVLWTTAVVVCTLVH